MKKNESYIIGLTNKNVDIFDLTERGITCTLTSTGKLIFKNKVISKMGGKNVKEWKSFHEDSKYTINPPHEDIEVAVKLQGVYGPKSIIILCCSEIVNESEITPEEIKSISDNEFLVTRAINGKQESIILTKEEMQAIHSKMERHFKICECLDTLNESLGSDINYESLTAEQKEILEKVENAFEDSLMEDIGPVYDATISSYKEELKLAFPDLDFDIKQFA